MVAREIRDRVHILDILDDLGLGTGAPLNALPCAKHAARVRVAVYPDTGSDTPPRSVTVSGCCEGAIAAFLRDINRRWP